MRGTVSNAVQPYISVVFSFWNEEENIPELLLRTRQAFVNLLDQGEVRGYELVFVNDASTDRSEALLKEAARDHDDIRIINMSRNFGLAPCIMAGFAHAVGDAVIYLDADLQDPPELIPTLVRTWRSKNVDVVHTVRERRDGESVLKLFLTWIGYRTLRFCYSIDLPVEAGDYKLLSRRVVDQLVELREKKPFIRGLVRWVGYKQTSIAYRRAPRHAGDTHFPVLGARVILNFIESALLSFSELPLRAIGGAGLLLCLLGSTACLSLLFSSLVGDRSPKGWEVVLSVGVLIGGIQLVGMGILALYLGTIYQEVKQRPNYIVKDTFGHKRGGG